MGQWTSDGEHIWLRQSVRFTVGDQERTLEIAVPIRPGADADEVERLLAEAGAGMDRLTTHLDARVATVRAGPQAAASGVPVVVPAPVAPGPVTPAPIVQAPSAPTPSAPTPSAPAHDVPERERVVAERRPNVEPESPPASTRRPPERPERAETEHARAEHPEPEPTLSEPKPAEVTRSARTPPPSQRPAASAPAASAPEHTAALAPIDRRQFLAETQGLGLNPRQVMDQLGVRSLDGLNYAEALETLRRQHLRAESGAAESSSTAFGSSGNGSSGAVPARAHAPTASTPERRAPAASSAPPSPARATGATEARPPASPPSAPSSAAPPRTSTAYFDEEDDLELTPGMEDELDEDFALGENDEAGPGVDDYGDDGEDEDEGIETIDLDELARDDPRGPGVAVTDARDGQDGQEELDDVPDFAAGPAVPRAGAGSNEGRGADHVALAAGGLDALRRRGRARELVERFRAVSKTGTPQERQLSSYNHAVAGQIGAEDAAFLTRALFRTTPERTSRDQLQELISWSKEDAFADEAADVLALLRAARPTDAAAPEASAPEASALEAQSSETRPPEARPPEARAGEARSARSSRIAPAVPGTARPRGQPREGRS
jgi:hypothetical protein